MRLIRRPWIWLLRFRKRKGYGVHSPFAFSFIRGVVLEGGAYYAYAPLSLLHPWWVRWGRLYPMTCRRLLFRLANFAEPRTVRLLTEDEVAKRYVRAAVPRAAVFSAGEPLSANEGSGSAGEADFVLVDRQRLPQARDIAAAMPERGMLVCEGIHRGSEALETWHSIQQHPHTGVTFDLYTYGVALFNPALHKQHYKVNF